MAANERKILRCAVYTRKSSEHGLEQDFNSLDAQREAGEAYIKSQAHEGWIILQSTGVVSGEFGLVEAYKQKREAVATWLSDGDSKVRSFAQKYVGSLDLQIAAEQRRSEEDIEMRKRMYDDPGGEDQRS